MKKLLLIVLLLAIPSMSRAELSDDVKVALIILSLPRIIVVDTGIPNEVITVNRMYREYWNFEEGQPFTPYPLTRLYTANDEGIAWIVVGFGRFLITVGDQQKEIAAGAPLKTYVVTF